MQITKQTPERLVVEQKNLLMQVIPWSLGGAGLLLALGMMDEYGIQSWYRMPYWLGGSVAVIGLLFALTVPLSYRTIFNRKNNQVRVQARRGIRVIYLEQYPLDTIEGIRIEEGQRSSRQGQVQARYRMTLSVLGEWVPLLPVWQDDLHDHRAVARQVQAFLGSKTNAEG
jgi:hypothetical protein